MSTGFLETLKNKELLPVAEHWKLSCANTECTLHQLSPYIGKLKSSIAGELVERYSKKGDLIVDPFAGSGTIPLEALLRGRRAFSADISEYAAILTTAKLSAPSTLGEALAQVESALSVASSLPSPDLNLVPEWVKHFFNSETLIEALRFAEVVRLKGNEFLQACFLGILHHQRPGFLSYPSSNLVPYLRDRKFPRSRFPEMYAYRDVKSRIIAKIKRAYKRVPLRPHWSGRFHCETIAEVKLPKSFDALITSPPYMNALDYGRDNRLRLWFISGRTTANIDNPLKNRREAFASTMEALANKIQKGLKVGGYCVLVVGEECNRSFKAHPSDVVCKLMSDFAPSVHLQEVFTDDIPDIRRTRKEYRAIKTEHFLVFKKER